MKKWLLIAAVIAAAGVITRLPHPARDISRLEPVRLVAVYEEAAILWMETDTGSRGSGASLAEAAAALRAGSDREIFLETAEFLLLDPDVAVTAEFFVLLRPNCRVFYTGERADLSTAAAYLAAHPPAVTLAELRSGFKGIPEERSLPCKPTTDSIPSGSLQPLPHRRRTSPAAAGSRQD